MHSRVCKAKRMWFAPLVFVVASFVHAETAPSPVSVPDPRHISNGRIIPDESYADQPYIVKTDDGAWLCAMTTGPGKEGAQGQHVISMRSTDQGDTWTDRADVEPAGGPEASYAVLLKIPSGRVFVFYNHNTVFVSTNS